MQTVTITPSPNGSTTIFTLGTAPLTADHAFIFVNGRMLTRVANNPDNSQFILSGTALTLGRAPASTDHLHGYVETSSANMLIRERPVGDFDGIDRTYTVSSSIPGSSQVILIHNGFVLQPSGTGLGTFSRSGQVLTLHASHPAPVSTDQFDVLVQAPKITGAQFALTGVIGGVANGSNHFFTLGVPQVVDYAHTILVNHNGMVYAEDNRGAPAANEFQYDQGSQVIELGNAPESTDTVTYYAIGLTTALGDAFALWLASGKPRIILATFDGVDASIVRTTYRLATEYYPVVLGGGAGLGQEPFGEEPFGGGGQTNEYKGLLRSVPEMQRALNTEDISLTGNGTVVFNNTVKTDGTRELDAIFGQGGVYFHGQPILLEMTGKSGDLSYFNRRSLSRGVCGSQQYDAHTVTLPIQDTAGRLEYTITLRQCTTAEFPSLPVENVGTPIPEIWGYFYNLTPILIDPLTLTYLVAGHALENVDQVYNNGYPVAFVFNTTTRDRFRLLAGIQGSEQITCDGRGYRMLTTNIFKAHLGYVIEDVLRRKAEYSDFDFLLPRLRMFKNDTPYDVGIVVRTNRKVKDVVLELKRGLPSDLWWARNGKFVLAVRKDPATRIPKITLAGRQGFNQQGTLITPIAKTTLAYQPIETVQSSGLATSISGERREFLANPFREHPFLNPDEHILRKFPLAEEEQRIETRFMNLADIQAIGALRHALFGVPRFTFTDEFDLLPLAIDIGDVFDYTSPRYQAGQSSPRWLAMSITERLGTGAGKSRATITGWQ